MQGGNSTVSLHVTIIAVWTQVESTDNTEPIPKKTNCREPATLRKQASKPEVNTVITCQPHTGAKLVCTL